MGIANDLRPAAAGEPIDQGDLIDDCLVLRIKAVQPTSFSQPDVDFAFRRIIVLTQTCDLANDKATMANVAEVLDARFLIDQKLFKPADVKGSLAPGESGAGISCRPMPRSAWRR